MKGGEGEIWYASITWILTIRIDSNKHTVCLPTSSNKWSCTVVLGLQKFIPAPGEDLILKERRRISPTCRCKDGSFWLIAGKNPCIRRKKQRHSAYQLRDHRRSHSAAKARHLPPILANWEPILQLRPPPCLDRHL